MKKACNKNVLGLGLVSFINDTASDMILPILPLFISSIGGGGLAIGLISGLGESIASLFKMFSGYLSDKVGRRKPFVFSGYLISALAKLFFSLATSWPQVLILKVMERFGKGLRTAPRDALLASSTKEKERGKGFGFHRMMDSGGAVLGTLLVIFLFGYLGFNFRAIFLSAGIISFFSLIPLFFVKEKKPEREEESFSLKIGLKNLPPSLKLFIIIATLFALGNLSYMFFILKSYQHFNLILRETKIATLIPLILYGLYNVSYTLFAYPVGILSDKIGRREVLLAGYALFGLVSLGFLFSSLPLFIILFILFGLNYALVNATERAFVSDLSQEGVRGTALGTFHSSVSLATLPAGIIAGFLWDLNPAYPFLYGALISFLVVILFLVFCQKGKKQKII